jgi:hypothetical protein
MKIISEARKRTPNDPSPFLNRRRREVKVDPCLVANGMFYAWWLMEGSKLGGQWNVKEKHLFTSSIFPTTTFTQTFNFFL